MQELQRAPPESGNPLDHEGAHPVEPTRSESDDSRLLSLAVAVVIITTLYVAREILIPIAAAILLSFILAPAVRFLRRIRLGRVPSVVVAVALALGVIVALGGLIGTQVSQIAIEIPRYSITIEQKVTALRSSMVVQLTESFGTMGKRLQRAASEPPPAADPARQPAPVTTEPKPLPVELHPPALTPLQIIEQILLPIVAPLATIGIMFIVAVFVLLQQTDLRDRFIRLFGLRDQHRMTTALGDAGTRLSHYLLTLLGLNVAFGVLIVLGLLVIGVPNPLLWGALAGLCRFVPYIGALIAGILPTVFAAAVDPGWTMAMATAALFVISETVMGQFVDPLVYGRSTGLSPVSVIVMTIFWSWIWGPVGLILSMPLTVCLLVLGRHVPRLTFLEVLMGDRPALTPVEGFYQRILANDLDETQYHAEAFLKDHPLSDYYDDVVLPGLRLAAHDAERGVLTPRQLTQIQQTMPRLLKELDDRYDAAAVAAAPIPDTAPQTASVGANDEVVLPHPASASASDPAIILCVSGREVLDKPATDMLAQLLRHGGMHARAVTYVATSREAIADLDVAGVAMVCITYLQLSGNPAHLRYLIRRIRGRLPAVPVLVGLWPTDDLISSQEDRLLMAVGADDYGTFLMELVDKCRAIVGAPDAAVVTLKQ